MAVIENSQQQKSNSSKKFVKKSTRVDLTPMVDLGFLLITFFVFTSTMAKPTAMKVNMPYDKSEPSDEICNSCALTAVLFTNNLIRYYEGNLINTQIHTTNYEGIRQIIQDKKKMVEQVRGSRDQFVLIIKPSAGSSFKNFVDMVDEVTINNVQRYYIDELSVAETNKMLE